MKVAENCIVSLDYSLHLGDGVIIDSSEGQPLSYLHGQGQIVPGLEKALLGLESGETKQVVVSAADGYGDRDPSRLQQVSMASFGGKIVKAGDEFVAVDDHQNEMPVRVEKVAGDDVTVDFNHPLAGKELHFSVTIKEVRAATEEEKAHGHAHGEDGHHH